MILSDLKKKNQFIFLCTFIYFISYITRINYGAVISEMVTDTGFAKSVLSVALTGSFITYGLGQLISGFLGDRIQPKHLISIGLVTTVLMNLLIPFCSSPVQMTAAWCVNGIAQSFMWPPLVKLMSAMLPAEDYNRGTVRVSWGSSSGTIFIYLVSPLLITISGWRTVFLFCAAAGAVGLFLWQKACPVITLSAAQNKMEKKHPVLITPFLFFLMLAIVCQGILKDGVTTWMPSYISETYHLSNEISILSGVLLPVFSILCFQITSWLYQNKLKNPILCAAVLFGTGTSAAFILYLCAAENAAASVILSAILTGCMHGVNLILICMFPRFFVNQGNVSMISGLLNSCTYVGSAVSTYTFPLISEQAGWAATLLLWGIIALSGTMILLFSIPSWSRFKKKLEP